MIDSKSEDRKSVEREFKRMGFDKDSTWRISDINKDFELCNTYPRFLILPANFKDEDIDSVAKFRYFRRIPTAVWRHARNGCFIVRSSQPTVGWFGWFRNEMDESLVQSYVNITIQHTEPNGSHSDRSCVEIGKPNGIHETKNNGDACTTDKSNDNVNKLENGALSYKDAVKYHNGDGNCCSRAEGINGNDNIRGNLSDVGSKSTITTTATTTTTPVTSNGLDPSTGKTNHDIDDDSRDYDGNQNSKSNQNQNYSDPDQDNHKAEDEDAIKAVDMKVPNHVLSDTNGRNDLNLANELDRSASISEQKHSSTSSSSPIELNGDKEGPLTMPDSESSEQATKPTNISDTQSPTPATATDTVTAETNTTTLSSSKMLIIDARSYAAAMANRAKGGGCECSEYYQKCEVHFMNLANIHSIRKSYHAIRGVCEAYSEQSNNWVSFLDNSRWLHHISGLIKSSLLVVDAIDVEEKSIMIHCSDGWDRTPQLVALAEIMLDPHYRTFEGFKVLVQREWLDFGHKFADRCGSNPCNEDPNERCPVFLQWLDCVQQLLVQFPKHFEFNAAYLDKLNRHTFSNVFGTFSYNSTQERILSKVDDKLLSLWSYFDSARSRYRNENYVENDDILRPSFKVKDLHFWKEVYLPPIDQPKGAQSPFLPITNNIDNNKCSQDSLFIDGPANGTVCK